MKKTSVAMMIALLAGWAVPSMPSHAQMPNINLMADQPGKTPEEKEAGGVRTTTDAPKTPAVKTTAAKKPKATANTN
jgi:hypothetical protein